LNSSTGQWYQLSASFSNGIQPFSEAKPARLDIHVALGLAKSLQADTIVLLMPFFFYHFSILL
jgi:putative NADPH-quinone reductase